MRAANVFLSQTLRHQVTSWTTNQTNHTELLWTTCWELPEKTLPRDGSYSHLCLEPWLRAHWCYTTTCTSVHEELWAIRHHAMCKGGDPTPNSCTSASDSYISAILSHSPCGLWTDRKPLFLLTKSNKWPLSYSKSLWIWRNESSTWHAFFFSLLFHKKCRWTST